MKKILFHSLTIPPDNVSTGMLVAEIADGFKEMGVSVEILASSPQYNIENNGNLTLDKYYTSSYKDINITHINSSNRSFNKITRFFQWLTFHYQTIKFLSKNRNNYSHIFIFSYPPTMNLVVIYIKKFLKIKVTYSCWELYPEIANKTFKTNSGILFNIFKKIDSYAMKLADNLVVNSSELKTYLINNRGIKDKDIKSIYHFSPYQITNENPKLNKKIILYAGNMGKPQNIKEFINTFNSIKEVNWKLEFFGAGEEFDSIKDLENEQLSVFEHLPRNELYEKTKDIPVALISLDKDITVEGFPGKTFDYLSMNKVLLCFANSDSAVSKFIDKFELGFTIDPNDKTSMGTIFDKLNDQSLLLNYQKNINNLNKNILNKSKVVEDYYSLI
ncbi:MAG: glycosyltransferase family 4 protein [Candidatus Actinomarina sp.]